MRVTIAILFFWSICSFAKGQGFYSETKNKGVIIQNSLPRGGPYIGPVNEYFNVSNLIFYTRVKNETEHPFELTINFSSDSIAIPNSPGTFVKLFLPPDTMTLEKRSLFNYGVKDLDSFNQSTQLRRKLKPNEDCLFNVVTIFYQTEAGEVSKRGGNRAALVLKGNDLFYSMPPQIDSLPCGHIVFSE